MANHAVNENPTVKEDKKNTSVQIETNGKVALKKNGVTIIRQKTDIEKYTADGWVRV